MGALDRISGAMNWSAVKRATLDDFF
jgi:hypothetical protein